MKNILTFLIALFSIHSSFAAYVTVPISSGLNADVIVNGVGTAIATTTNDVDAANFCLVAQGWQQTSSSSALSFGLPSSGTITSAITTGLSYQLASYTGNNSLRINSSTPTTLTLLNQLTAQNVYLLGHSGSGTCVMSAKVNFTDNTNQVFPNISVGDWFYGTPSAYGGMGRIGRLSNITESYPSDPRFYQYALAISVANQTKQIASIEITRSSGTGILNVYAVSYQTTVPVITCPTPTNLLANTITSNSVSLNWTETGTATQWQIKYGAAGFLPATGGTSIYTSSKPYPLSSLTPATSYDYYVRAICGAGDTSLWSVVKNFSTLCVPPTILTYTDSNRCGPGVIQLNATTNTGATINWYQSSIGGSVIGSGNTYNTPVISTTTTYYAGASTSSTCISARQAVVATIKPLPIVNLGNDTTICPGISYTLNAQNSGSSYLWNTNETTQTIMVDTAGTFAVSVTATNNCTSVDTIHITNGIVPQNLLPATIDLCVGDTATLNAGNLGSSFSWNTGATTQIIKTNAGGNFSVLIKSINGCKITSSIDVSLRPLPIIHLGNDTSICENATLVLNAGNPGAIYYWNTGAQTQTITTIDSGIYTVIVTTVYGCTNAAQRHIAYTPVAKTEGFNFIPQFQQHIGQIQFSPINPTNTVNYEWDFGDGTALSTSQNPIHIFFNNGIYTVTLKVSNECGNTSLTQNISVNLTTGVVALGNPDMEVDVYPNPSKDVVFIESKSDVNIQKVALFNILGQQVLFRNNKDMKKVNISVAGLSNGIYMLHIETNKGLIIRKIEMLH